MTKIIWWESSITEHQFHTLKELSEIEAITLKVYCTSIINQERRKQGWKECNWDKLDITVVAKFDIRFWIKNYGSFRDSVNIFGGPFDSIFITAILCVLLYLKLKVFILTEPYSPLGVGLLNDGSKLMTIIRSKLRPLKFRLLWLLFRTKVTGVFAISDLAMHQLINFGVEKNKIFPFGYFVPQTTNLKMISNKQVDEISSNNLSLIFIGTFNHTKGVDNLIDVVNEINKSDFSITLDMFGPCRDVSQYNFSKNIRYLGVLPNIEVQAKIKEYDFLILPSRYDGWGVVINESLLSGTPVICSSNVGASILVKKLNVGKVFSYQDPCSLLNILQEVCQNKKQLIIEYKKSIRLHPSALQPRIAARYLYLCVSDKIGSERFTQYWFNN